MSTRNTIQRQIVLDAVRTLHSKHPTADEIYQHILHEHPGLGRATVYRNLSILSENGRIQLPVIPEENVSRGHKLAAKMIAVTVLLGVIALALWGVYLITEVGTMLGVIPIAVAAIISIAQIVAGIVLYRKHH